MGAFNINTYYGCASCEAADKYGNGCKHGLMFPRSTYHGKCQGMSEL